MRQSLQGKTALVTGGAQRLGKATVRALAKEGMRVVVHFHHSDMAAQELVQELTATGAEAWALAANLAQPEEGAALIAQALELTGALDLLVNNASTFPADRLADVTWDALTASMAVNAWAPFELGREFARLIGRGGIINLLDARLSGYDWTHVSYMLAKQLLALITRLQAVEYAPHITVNAVAPGLILPPEGQDESYLTRLAATVPLRRHGEAVDIADAVVYLAQSTFLTGNVLYVDGGRHLLEYSGGQSNH